MSVASVWIVLTQAAAVGIPIVSAAVVPLPLELELLVEDIRMSQNLTSPAPEPDTRAYSLRTRTYETEMLNQIVNEKTEN